MTHEVYAVEWCGCIYESGFSVSSLHSTKRGAIKEMVGLANSAWYQRRAAQLIYGGTGHDPLIHEAWRVVTHTVIDEELT